MKFETQVIHEGEEELRTHGAVALPIFQSSTYAMGDESDYHKIRYLRLNNSPNHELLHKKLAALEEAEAALVFASGMAAISTTLLTLVRSGDHVLSQNCVYGGTGSFFRDDLSAAGGEVSYVDLHDPSQWEQALRSNTKVFYVESMTNPMLEVGELEQVVQFCRDHNLVSVIDNTFASPYNFKPCKLGFDLSLHSATKSLNGHSDIVGGAVMGAERWVKKIKHKLDHLGGCMDPHACFLLNRGVKTLALRMDRQNYNAQQLAEFLASRPEVDQVIYPGLSSHRDFDRAKKWFRGPGSMLSFEIKGGVAEADRLIANLRLPLCAPSLGGVESLITRPSTSSHAGLTSEERQRAGISDRLIRYSVGVESIDDLREDFIRAFSNL